MGLKWVWCGICAKYLTFDTYPTSTVGALMFLFCYEDAEKDDCKNSKRHSYFVSSEKGN